LFSWQEDNLNLAIIEVPEGRELTSDLLTPTLSTNLAKRLAELYRIRYRQRVSQSSLLERLERSNGPCLEAVQALGLDVAPYEKLLKGLEKLLRDEPKLFRTNKVRVHGDLWWPNIMVAEEDVYLIDWESMHRGDPAEDLAKFRLVTYWPRNEIAPTYFWQHPSHVPRISRALASIVEHYNTSVGNDDLSKRLRFYLPFLCVYELGLRYTMVQTESAFSTMTDRILATEALRLFEDPLAYPPDLKAIGYAALLDEAMAAS
jgi:thiamine kinase-like enzyme